MVVIKHTHTHTKDFKGSYNNSLTVAVLLLFAFAVFHHTVADACRGEEADDGEDKASVLPALACYRLLFGRHQTP